MAVLPVYYLTPTQLCRSPVPAAEDEELLVEALEHEDIQVIAMNFENIQVTS
jgi:hypothetical protein